MKKRHSLHSRQIDGHRIDEYPLLHAMLTSSFATIYEGSTSGSPVHRSSETTRYCGRNTMDGASQPFSGHALWEKSQSSAVAALSGASTFP